MINEGAAGRRKVRGRRVLSAAGLWRPCCQRLPSLTRPSSLPDVADLEDVGDVADDEVLRGGLVNHGQVRRRGDAVRRPARPHARLLHRYLNALADQGFDGTPRPLSLTGDGYEELTYVPGDVPISPFPDWALSDETLASVGRLLRRTHDAAARVPASYLVAANDDAGSGPSVGWPTEFADPEGGPILCHNDVCPENSVFRDGRAVALIDFDFAAPGRPIWDLAFCAWYWVPTLPPQAAAAEGQPGLNVAARLRILADAYGLDEAGRRELVDVLPVLLETSRRFVDGRVAAGDPVFTRIDAERDPERWDKTRAWLAANRDAFS